MKQDSKTYLVGPTEFALASFAFSFVWVALGYWVASSHNDPLWAARFGCIGVVYGLFVLVGFRWWFGQLRSGNAIWDRQVKTAIDSMSASSFDSSVRNFTAEMNKYGEYERSKWVFLAEVTTIAVGTIQWGFGDWVALNYLGIGVP